MAIVINLYVVEVHKGVWLCWEYVCCMAIRQANQSPLLRQADQIFSFFVFEE